MEERNYDELISDILIHLATLDEQLRKADTRMDLSVKRIVKLENCVEFLAKKQDSALIAFQEFIAMQSKLNKYFLDYIEKNPNQVRQ